MWYFLILTLTASSFVEPSSIDSSSSAAQSSRQKRDDESEPWKNPYLPNTIEPTQYDLHLDPVFYSNGTTFNGNVSIEINVLNQTKFIIVHKKQLFLRDWRAFFTNGSEIEVERHFDWPPNDYYVMETRNFMPDKAQLYFAFGGNMTLLTGSSFRRSGLYNIPYVDEAGNEKWLFVSDFRPSDARKVFPCFDEPRFKTPFKIALRHYEDYTALSNMPVESDLDTPTTYYYDTVFKLSPKMSTYQVAFAVTAFASKNKTVDGKLLRVWAHQSRLDKVDYALEVTPTIQNYLKQELDMPYSLEKMDQIAVPGGLLSDERENWGLVTQKESTLLFDATKDGDSARFEALKLIAHALAHNYFGNLVTCRYWEHVWLNEGLATFYEIRALTEVDTTVAYKEYFFGKKVEAAMFVDASKLLLPAPLIESSDDSFGAVIPRFDLIMSDKGAAVLRMVERIVGADTFKSGIRQYLRQNANGTVVTDNLWNALQQEIGDRLDIKTVMMNWVEKDGFPVIKVELLPGNQINATQKQFLDNPIFPSNETSKWYVPLTYRKKGGTENLVWMNATDVIFEIPELLSDDWIEFNCDRTGYYRVNYGDNLWSLLAKQLNEDHTVFTELSRSKFFSDAAALVKIENITWDVFLNLTRYASKEKKLTPWFGIFAGFRELIRIFNTTTFRSVQNYVLSLTSNLMDELQVKDEGSYIEKLVRSSIMALACTSGHQGCIDNTTRAFRALIENDETNAVPSEYLHHVYCTGIGNSVDESEWTATLERYKRVTSSDERGVLLRALSCTRNVTLLERLLANFIDTTFVPAISSYVIQYVAENPYSENYAWTWLKSKYAEIDAAKGNGYAGRLLPDIVHNFDTPAEYQEVVDFYNVYPNVSETNKQQAKFLIDKNILWLEKHFPTIANWFDKNA